MPPDSGTFEQVLRATGIPRVALDIRNATGDCNSAFLAEPHDFRRIGAGALDNQFFSTRLATQFDV